MDKREVIDKAAFEIVVEKGYEKLTMKEVSRKTGLALKEIESIYSSKTELINSLLTSILTKKLDFLKSLNKSETTLQKKLINLLDHHFDYLATHPRIAELVIDKTMLSREHSLPAIDNFINEFPAELSKIIDRAVQNNEIRKVDTRLVASAMFHAIHGVTLKVKYDENYNYPQAKRELINLFCIGVKS